MTWIAISGSWKVIDEKVEREVRESIREIFECGDGIVTGGALGVDYIATKEMLALDPSAESIRIFLPTNLKEYALHYHKRVIEGVIMKEQAENLIALLEYIQKANPKTIREGTPTLADGEPAVNERTYFARNSDILAHADKLIAFQVNKSRGTEDTIMKAHANGIPVIVHSYRISSENE